MTELATIDHEATMPKKRAREVNEVIDPVPILDTARFEHMQRIAGAMARSTLMPESLWMEGKRDDKTPLPYEQVLSNCFLVVNQAVRWGMDPFAVAQCVSVVHGKLCYEGKLVSAVLQAKLGINLHHHFAGTGEETRIYLSDRAFDEKATINGETKTLIEFLKPGIRAPGFRLFDGSVAEWKTTGNNSPWSPKNFQRMLIYRGTRDWCRIYEPALMLGVYTPDEMDDLETTSRYQAARDVTPKSSLSDRLALAREATQQPQDAQEGFDPAHVARETHDALTGEIIEPDTGEVSTPGATAEVPSASQEDGGRPASDAPSSPLPSDLRVHLIDFARKAAKTAADEHLSDEAKMAQIEDMLMNYREVIEESQWPKLSTIKVCFHAVLAGKRTHEQARKFIAVDLLDCSVAEIGGAA